MAQKRVASEQKSSMVTRSRQFANMAVYGAWRRWSGKWQSYRFVVWMWAVLMNSCSTVWAAEYPLQSPWPVAMAEIPPAAAYDDDGDFLAWPAFVSACRLANLTLPVPEPSCLAAVEGVAVVMSMKCNKSKRENMMIQKDHSNSICGLNSRNWPTNSYLRLHRVSCFPKLLLT